MQLFFKKCTHADIAQLAQLSLSTFTEAFEKDNNPSDFQSYVSVAFTKQTLATELENNNSDFYFLFADQQLAGYFKLNIADAQSEQMALDAIELERIYVKSTFQAKGLGTFMVKEAIRLANNLKMKKLWLGVWQKNHKAIRFYEKHGFEKFGTHLYYIGEDKQTDWLMQLKL